MKANITKLPRYAKNQVVCFMGGVGTIKNYQPHAGTWSYAIEMEMGPKPDFGRIGFETTVLLYETEIHGVLN